VIPKELALTPPKKARTVEVSSGECPGRNGRGDDQEGSWAS
jgi:hypothetical protein